MNGTEKDSANFQPSIPPINNRYTPITIEPVIIIIPPVLEDLNDHI